MAITSCSSATSAPAVCWAHGGPAGKPTERILPALLEEVRALRPDYLLVEAHAVWGNLLAQIESVPRGHAVQHVSP